MPFVWGSAIALLLAVSVQNFFYYPSYFDLFTTFSWIQEAIVQFTSSDVSLTIESTNKAVAITVSLGILVLLPGIMFKKVKPISVFILSIFVLLYYTAEWQTHGFSWGFPLETAARVWLLPTAFLFGIYAKMKIRSWMLVLLVITFAGHGLFALDVLPRPGYYVDMTSRAFMMDEEGSIRFLMWIGVLDLLVFPAVVFKRTRTIALVYMIIWGFLTALARPVYNWSSLFIEESILIWVPEFLERAPHFLLPLGLFLRRQLPFVKV
jgi:hypothetical protein